MNDSAQDSRQDGEAEDSLGTPLCPQCLTPVDPSRYYCEKCGYATGQLTPYIPFVNVRFNYAIVGAMWTKAWWNESTSLPARIGYCLLLVLWAPIMIVGLPFVIWQKLRRRRRELRS